MKKPSCHSGAKSTGVSEVYPGPQQPLGGRARALTHSAMNLQGAQLTPDPEENPHAAGWHSDLT
ncbi:MAG: hypothetical protein CM1200mP14_24220 [Gammaproteobacteria bacterium]|nr:MAG: hypothetical protein CM1200mP14_24220 [Gammaproteobacteria bacterium]